jgi:hypothetical protein
MTTLAEAIATPSGININGAIGRQAAGASKSVAFSNEDFAILDGLETKLDSLMSSPLRPRWTLRSMLMATCCSRLPLSPMQFGPMTE